MLEARQQASVSCTSNLHLAAAMAIGAVGPLPRTDIIALRLLYPDVKMGVPKGISAGAIITATN